MRKFKIASIVLLALSLAPILAKAQTISTVAGGGPNNLPAISTGVGLPFGVVVDKFGNVYISGGFEIVNRVTIVNNMPVTTQVEFPLPDVFKVDVSGNLTIYAGNDNQSFSGDNGSAASASLNFPLGLAVDSSGNLFIVDFPRIRRVDAVTHIITTVAGTGTSGFSGDNGPATSAQLNPGGGIAVDKLGNLFIADTFNNRIRRVDATTQVITTVAGNGTSGFAGDGAAATGAQLQLPVGVSVDPSGNLFIADTNNCAIRRVDATTQVITTVAGVGLQCGFSGDNAAATSAHLNTPFSLTVDAADDIFIADSFNNVVRRVDGTTHNIATVAGVPGTFGFTGDNGPATSAELSLALLRTISGQQFVVAGGAVALDAAGDLLIADTTNRRVRIVNASTQVIKTMAGNGFFDFGGDNNPATNAELSEPDGIARDSSGNIFISDELNSRIRRVDGASGNITTIAGDGKFAFSGDNGPASSAELSGPFGMTLDNSGNLLFSDGFNHRVRMINGTTQVISTIAGNGTGGFNGDNILATSAELFEPDGIAVDSTGNIFIADQLNARIRRVDHTTGKITTVAGNGTAGSIGDNGPATSAELNDPVDVSVDKAGNLFIAEALGNRIRRVDGTTGVITTVAGTGTAGFTGNNGPAINAKLNAPFGVIPDACDNLFIADSNNGVIRRVDSLSGIITTVAGDGIFGFSSAGVAAASGSSGASAAATSAMLNFPVRMVFDSSGNLFLVDLGANRIRRVTGLGIMNAVSCPNPVPLLTSLLPNTAAAGGAGFTLTVNGSNFVGGSVVQWKGGARTTTFVSATQVTAAIPAADIQAVGTAAVTVVTPTPGGGTSNALTFTTADFSVSSPTGQQAVPAGQSAMFTIATASVGGTFPGTVTFSATGLPAGANATFNPPSVAPGANTTMTVTTTARTTTLAARRPSRPRGPLFPAWMASLAMAMLLAGVSIAKLARNAVRRFAPVAVLAVVVIAGGYLAGCAGGFPKVGTTTGTPAGTFTITVTGASGADTHSTTVTLTVQ